jgi:hypothetical protein
MLRPNRRSSARRPDRSHEGTLTVDGRRPILILGRHLASFLHVRRERRRQRCRAGELYCFRCRAPKGSVAHTVEYLPLTATSGNLRAVCADCGTRMYRRVSLSKLAAVTLGINIALPEAQQRLIEGANPSVNCELEQKPDAQRGK